VYEVLNTAIYPQILLTDEEQEYNEDARRKLANAGLTSDEEDEGAAGASGYDTDSNQADAPRAGSRQPQGEDAELAAAGAVKGGKHKQKQSRSRSKSRERDAKGTPRLKKRQREPGQSRADGTSVCYEHYEHMCTCM